MSDLWEAVDEILAWRKRAEAAEAEVTRLREQLDEARAVMQSAIWAIDRRAGITARQLRDFLARSEVQP